MLKGSRTAISVSVIVHLALLLILVFGAPKTLKPAKSSAVQVKPAIKSFLYKAPKKSAHKNIEKYSQVKRPLAQVKNPSVASKIKPAKPATKPVAKPVANPASTQETLQKNANKSSEIKSAKSNSTKQPIRTNKARNKPKQAIFSSFEQLSRLRKKLDMQQRDKAFAHYRSNELRQKNPAGVMNGSQKSVPRTLVPLTTEQQKTLNTSSSHVSSITKNDDGSCTIYREQILGSPVPATTSFFGCGESKFDKSFREHMQKVQAKLGINPKH